MKNLFQNVRTQSRTNYVRYDNHYLQISHLAFVRLKIQQSKVVKYFVGHTRVRNSLPSYAIRVYFCPFYLKNIFLKYIYTDVDSYRFTLKCIYIIKKLIFI